MHLEDVININFNKIIFDFLKNFKIYNNGMKSSLRRKLYTLSQYILNSNLVYEFIIFSKI